TTEPLLQSAESAGVALPVPIGAEQRQEEGSGITQFLHFQAQKMPGLERGPFEAPPALGHTIGPVGKRARSGGDPRRRQLRQRRCSIHAPSASSKRPMRRSASAVRATP